MNEFKIEFCSAPKQTKRDNYFKQRRKNNLPLENTQRLHMWNKVTSDDLKEIFVAYAQNNLNPFKKAPKE